MSIKGQPTPLLRAVVIVLSLFAAAAASDAQQAGPTPDPTRFEKSVLAYEAADATAPPQRNAILLAGDSQFFRWKTFAEDLAGYNVINRGVDSFQSPDLLYYTDRLVLRYKPRMVVLHIGGNDVHNGRTPDQVLGDFKAFVGKVRAAQPDVPVAFTSITPSPGRWQEADVRRAANRLIKDYVATQKGLSFIDLWDAMLGPDGQPREDLWVADRIHPNHDGYLIRVRIMRPLLGPPDKP